MRFYPAAGQHGPQDIEVFLDPDPLPPQVVAEIPGGHMEIVMHAGVRGEELRREPAELRRGREAFPVDNGRVQPFEQRRVAPGEQAQGLAQLPTGDVQQVGRQALHEVRPALDRQVPFGPLQVDEPAAGSIA